MIVDDIDRLGRYAGLLPGVAQAAVWLDGRDLDALVAEGDPTIPLAGERLLAMPQTQPLKARENAKWEAHRRYADIQIVAGDRSEGFGWCPRRSGLAVAEPHDDARDVAFYDRPAKAKTVWFTLNPGQFVLFLPEDVHAPLLGEPGTEVAKVVLKVEVAQPADRR